MSTINTETRILRPSPETLAAIADGRVPDWRAPLNTARSYEGRHQAYEDLTTRHIPAGRIAALRERVALHPVVSAPVHVPEPVTASSSRAKLAMLMANMRRRVQR